MFRWFEQRLDPFPAAEPVEPPATLFAIQIVLGVVFGIWGLALALPLLAIAKVMIDYCKGETAPG